jgi:lipid II:glycine glycyltransferase (peptidoglycan interpeptide bridge formation enzyme)
LYTHPQDGKRVAALHVAFRAAADELGACSVFLRLHPLFGGPVGVGVQFSACLAQGETVSIDLTRTEEEMWRQTRENHRRDIRRLEKLNFAPVVDDWNLYGEFARMYRQTMMRLGAESSYHFSDEYFADLRTALGDKLHLCCVVSSADRVAAGGLFTSVNDIMEYHLSGSDPEYRRLAPTKLMMHFMRLWGKRGGYSVLHLGGGVGSQSDALHEFKAGFSPDRHVFRTCRMITNEGRYAALTLRAGLPLDLSADLEADFFPAYRRDRMDRPPIG